MSMNREMDKDVVHAHNGMLLEKGQRLCHLQLRGWTWTLSYRVQYVRNRKTSIIYKHIYMEAGKMV